MSLKAITWAYSQKVGNPTGKAVLVAIANYADDSGYCWPSVRKISQITEINDRSVRIWVSRLEKAGVLKKSERTRSDGGTRSNSFYLSLEDGNDIQGGMYQIQGGVNQVQGEGESGSGAIYRNEPSIEPSIEISIPKNKPRQKKKTKSPPPDQFPVTEQMKAFAEAKGVKEDLEDITESFLIYHRKHGNQFSDWYAAWQTWIRKHLEFDQGKAKEKQKEKQPWFMRGI